MEKIKIGKYQHYKGNVYEVLAVGRDSETLVDVVVYRGLYDSKEFGKNPVWVRPLEMFVQTVEVGGKRIPRFKYIGK